MKRALNFKKLWTKNFKENLNKESLESLGDRSLYVGSSDISGCLRKSYLQKLTRKEVSIEQSIILQRGHLAEDLVKKGFGIAFVSVDYYKEAVQSGEVQMIFPNFSLCAREIVCLSNKQTSNPALEKLLEIINEK